jgi:hypothetical protein
MSVLEINPTILSADEINILKKKLIIEGKIKFTDGKLCKIIDVDFKKNSVKCMPLYNTRDIYIYIPFSDIIKNQYQIIEGGSKSRKRLSRKRKGKKSYRKKKYGKTKKSRRFRRSVRSRR